MKTIAISGGTGFIGGQFTERKKGKYRFIFLGRDDLYGAPEKLSEKMMGIDGLIHLAGKKVVSRWTNRKKEEIYQSRIRTTQNIVRAIELLEKPPEFLISASAIGVYDENGMHTEASRSFAENFLAKIVLDWEKETLEAKKKGIRTCIIRLGIVLGKEGGMLPQIKPMFRYGLGAITGNGNQGFSFIHIDDVVDIIDWLIEHDKTSGIYNLTAPETMTYAEFARKFGACYQMPVWLKIPGWVFRILFGEGAVTLLEGQHAVPERLLLEGYSFHHPTLKSALMDITGRHLK